MRKARKRQICQAAYRRTTKVWRKVVVVEVPQFAEHVFWAMAEKGIGIRELGEAIGQNIGHVSRAIHKTWLSELWFLRICRALGWPDTGPVGKIPTIEEFSKRQLAKYKAKTKADAKKAEKSDKKVRVGAAKRNSAKRLDSRSDLRTAGGSKID